MRTWLTALSYLVLTCAFASLATGQYPPDGWFVSHQYSAYMAFTRNLTGLWGSAPFSSNLSQVVYDSGSTCYIQWTNYNVPVAVDRQTLSATYGYGYDLVGGYGGGLGVVARDRVWLMSQGRLGYTPTATPTGPFASGTYVGDVLAAVRAMYPQMPSLWGLCTNGRELFFTAPMVTTLPYHVFALDLSAPNPLTTIRPIANLANRPGRPTNHTTHVQIRMGPDGDLIALDGNLVRINPLTGVVQDMDPALWWTGYSPPSFLYPNAPFAYNVWENEAIALDEDATSWRIDRLFLYSGGAWSMRFTGFPWNMGFPETTSPVPFLLYGEGCRNALGKEPRMGWRGLARQGQTFTVTLRDAEPNGLGIFWIGGSKTHWPGLGALPFDASVFGAPGCRLLASRDMSYFVATDSAGGASLSIPVPVNPALNGYEVFAQTASTSGGNTLGFVASDAVAIRMR